MTGLLDDVLLLGKAESGHLKFAPNPLPLDDFCQELVESIQLTAKNHTIIYRSEPAAVMPWLDEKLLRQILGNLLSNAIKYSPQGSDIGFDVGYGQNSISFRVQDQGLGIPQPDQAQIYNSFNRASNVGTISGTGLGLAIVKKAVDLHGGKIELDSLENVGTTFTVTLPLNPQKESQ